MQLSTAPRKKVSKSYRTGRRGQGKTTRNTKGILRSSNAAIDVWILFYGKLYWGRRKYNDRFSPPIHQLVQGVCSPTVDRLRDLAREVLEMHFEKRNKSAQGGNNVLAGSL